MRDFLKENKVRHVLLTGYATDMCYCRTTAGYENLSKDFNVFLVGDATLATFPSNATPRFATNAALSFAALNQLITQISWVRTRPDKRPRPLTAEGRHAPDGSPRPGGEFLAAAAAGARGGRRAATAAPAAADATRRSSPSRSTWR